MYIIIWRRLGEASIWAGQTMLGMRDGTWVWRNYKTWKLLKAMSLRTLHCGFVLQGVSHVMFMAGFEWKRRTVHMYDARTRNAEYRTKIFVNVVYSTRSRSPWQISFRTASFREHTASATRRCLSTQDTSEMLFTAVRFYKKQNYLQMTLHLSKSECMYIIRCKIACILWNAVGSPHRPIRETIF